MTIRYDCEGAAATDSGCAAAGVDEPKKAQVATVEDQGSMTVSVADGVTDVVEFSWTTEPFNPLSADWPNGTYGFRVRTGTLQITHYHSEMHRVSSGCISQDQIGANSSDQTSSGVFLFEVTEDPGSGTDTDRFQGLMRVTNSEGMSKNIKVTPNFSEATEMYIEGPWVSAVVRNRAMVVS